MKIAKKAIKEAKLIVAAEKIFSEVGFKNAKMESIAGEAGITKVTLYAYFKSKENLYLAVTYKALQLLTDSYLEIRQANRDKSGIESCLELITVFMDFCEQNYLYSEVLLDYYTLIRSSNKGKDLAKMSDGIADSVYFSKIQTIQNEPFKIMASEIDRGQKDGSITCRIDPMLFTIFAWTNSIGYIKVISAAGDITTPMLHINFNQLKSLGIQIATDILRSDRTYNI
jgi:AcrR family transcriptional regulator